MVDTKGSALTEVTELTDDDGLYVIDDMDGTPSSKRITAANAAGYFAGGDFFNDVTVINNDRFDISNRQSVITIGPFNNFGGDNNTAVAPGSLVLGLVYVRGGTPSTVTMKPHAAGTSGDDVYYVLYSMDSNGLPTGTPSNQWGPFDADSTAIQTLTAQSETITAGWYWAGVFAPTANAGSPKFFGGRSCFVMYMPFLGGSLGNSGVLVTGDTASTTPPDVSSYDFGSSTGATRFAFLATGSPMTPILTGTDA